MRSNGVRKYVLQAVSLTLTCLLTLTSVASYLNLQNKWYPTLESIFADPNAPITDSHYGAPLTPVSQQVSEHTPEQENARGADSREGGTWLTPNRANPWKSRYPGGAAHRI